MEVDGQVFPVDSTIIALYISDSGKIYQLVLDDLSAGEELDLEVNWFLWWANNNDSVCEELEEFVYRSSLNM